MSFNKRLLFKPLKRVLLLLSGIREKGRKMENPGFVGTARNGGLKAFLVL